MTSRPPLPLIARLTTFVPDRPIARLTTFVPDRPGTRLNALLSGRPGTRLTTGPWRAAKTLTWILAACAAAVMASERVYWYWSGIDPESVGILTIFYGVAGAVGLFAMALTPGDSFRHVVFAAAAFALVVEAVLTPVIYEDGPLPLLFLMFVGWHGLLAWAGFVVLIRRWALAGRTRLLALASAAAGVLWGLWALSSGAHDDETADLFAEDGGSSEVLSPLEFGRYAVLVTLGLVAAHLVLDRVWPDVGWRPSRRAVITLGLLTAAMFSLLVLPVVFWAPIKMAALVAGLWWLRKRLPVTDPEAPTVVDRLSGRIRVASLVGLAPLPVVAAAVYAALWPVREAGSIAALWWWLIMVQAVAGTAAVVWAAGGRMPNLRRSRSRTAAPTP